MRIISGQYRGKKLLSPQSKTTRPTSDRARETIFNVLENNPRFNPISWKEMHVADLFAGTGAMGLEALSRGAQRCAFLENNPEAQKVLRGNIDNMAIGDHCLTLNQDATQLPSSHTEYDLVFLDPPYNKNLITPTLESLYKMKWLKRGTIVVIEVSKNEDVELPDFTDLVLEKKVGAAKVLFALVNTSAQ